MLILHGQTICSLARQFLNLAALMGIPKCWLRLLRPIRSIERPLLVFRGRAYHGDHFRYEKNTRLSMPYDVLPAMMGIRRPTECCIVHLYKRTLTCETR